MIENILWASIVIAFVLWVALVSFRKGVRFGAMVLLAGIEVELSKDPDLAVKWKDIKNDIKQNDFQI